MTPPTNALKAIEAVLNDRKGFHVDSLDEETRADLLAAVYAAAISNNDEACPMCGGGMPCSTPSALVVTPEQLVSDQTYATYVPTADDADIIGQPLADRLAASGLSSPVALTLKSRYPTEGFDLRLFLDGWKKGVLDAIDKLWAAKMTGLLAFNAAFDATSVDKIFELLNILLQHPPDPAIVAETARILADAKKSTTP